MLPNGKFLRFFKILFALYLFYCFAHLKTVEFENYEFKMRLHHFCRNNLYKSQFGKTCVSTLSAEILSTFGLSSKWLAFFLNPK
jgi:hypothetical protein